MVPTGDNDRDRHDGATDDAPAVGGARPVVVEFLVEPFTEAEPGPHVMAGVAAFDDHGLPVDLGPFASSSHGSLPTVAAAVADLVERSMGAGATSVHIHVGRGAGERLLVTPLHDALDTMIRSVERTIGRPADAWDRVDKQRAVRLLDDNGAFLLRGAVDDIARAMGVSRITIYNYLNAIQRYER